MCSSDLANVGESPLGTIRSVEYAAQNMEERLKTWQRDLGEAERNCRELDGKVGAAFEHETKLLSLVARQQELENALDITKNQAAHSLSAEESNEVEISPAEKTEAPAQKQASKNARKSLAVRC